MPESPRTRFRGRGRVRKISGADAGRILGRPVEPTYQLPPTPDLVSPRVPGRRSKRARRKALQAEVRLAHRAKLVLMAPAQYQATCSCGRWSAVVPARKGHHVEGFALHVEAEVDRELTRRRRS